MAVGRIFDKYAVLSVANGTIRTLTVVFILFLVDFVFFSHVSNSPSVSM